MKIIGNYLLNILKWLDIGINVIVLFGASNETVSERCGKARNAGREWGCVACRLLGYVFGKDHCDNALKTKIGEDAIVPDGQ